MLAKFTKFDAMFDSGVSPKAREEKERYSRPRIKSFFKNFTLNLFKISHVISSYNKLSPVVWEIRNLQPVLCDHFQIIMESYMLFASYGCKFPKFSNFSATFHTQSFCNPIKIMKFHNCRFFLPKGKILINFNFLVFILFKLKSTWLSFPPIAASIF